MKLTTLVPGVFLLLQVVHGQSLLDEFPDCAVPCLIDAFPATGCALTDLRCICTNEQFWAASGRCTLMSCSTKDAMTTQRVAKRDCGVQPRDHSIIMEVITPLFFGLATIFLLCRIIARSPRRFEIMGWDDALIIIAWAISAPMMAVYPMLVRNGLGQDLWQVTYEQTSRMLFWWWVAEQFYLFCTVATKISILTFYLRVFTDRKFKTAVYVMMGLCGMMQITYSMVIAFQCTPVSYAWHFFDNQAKGSCINLTASLSSSAATNILFDLLVLLFPLPQLLKLQLAYSWKTKAQIFIMFTVGLLVTIISAIRFSSLLVMATSTNVTWDFLPAAYWSVIEMYLGIMCACLPSVRIFVSRMLPKWLGTSRVDPSAPTGPRKTPSAKVTSSWKLPTANVTEISKNDDTSDSLPLTDYSESITSARDKALEHGGGIMRTDSYHVVTKELQHTPVYQVRPSEQFSQGHNKISYGDRRFAN